MAQTAVRNRPQIDTNAENTYWRENFESRPYYRSEFNYDDYSPAYRYGWERRLENLDRRWEDTENDLERDWEQFKASSRLKWEDAKGAVRDAWHRVEKSLPGDFDRDGR